jgi:hypothetical protein
MSIESVKSELSMARANGWLTSIHMHDGRIIEYAEILEFPDSDDAAAAVRIRTYQVLSGPRIIPKKKPHDLPISHISYADLHQDKPAPISE